MEGMGQTGCYGRGGGANRILVEGKGQLPLDSTSLDVTLLNVHLPNQPTGNVQLLLVGTSFSRSPAETGPILSPMTFRRNLHEPCRVVLSTVAVPPVAEG